MKAKSRRKRLSGNRVVSGFDDGVVFAQRDLKKNIAHVDPYFLAWQICPKLAWLRNSSPLANHNLLVSLN